MIDVLMGQSVSWNTHTHMCTYLDVYPDAVPPQAIASVTHLNLIQACCVCRVPTWG